MNRPTTSCSWRYAWVFGRAAVGDLRTLRRVLKLAMKWGRVKADEAVAVNEGPEGPGRAFAS
jgi:hypothetical protein